MDCSHPLGLIIGGKVRGVKRPGPLEKIFFEIRNKTLQVKVFKKKVKRQKQKKVKTKLKEKNQR